MSATQRRQILEALAARGWRHAHDLQAHEWWADEIVVFESAWSPVGARVLLVFLVDPQHEGPRRQGEAVWAVVASRNRPEHFTGGNNPVLTFGQGWAERLPVFVQEVEDLRVVD